MRQFSQPTISSQVHCRVSVSFSQPSIYPQMKTVTSLRNLSGLFPDTIRTPTYPLSMSTIINTVALACASGHHTATPEMKWKFICTHGISLSYLTCLCQSLFPSGLDTDFAPRSGWQVSQVVSLYHASAWRVLGTSQWNRTRVLSLNNFRVQVTGWFDV